MLKNRKIRHISLLPILLISFILFKLVNNTEILINAFKFTVSLLSYIIWAFGIAYLLNPLMVYLESRFKLKRIFSMIAVYTFFIGCIVFFITILTPIIIKNIGDLLNNLPKYFIVSKFWVYNKIFHSDLFAQYDLKPLIDQNIYSMSMQIRDFLKIFLDKLITNAITITSTLLKFIFGTLISMYLLYDKEKFILSSKRILFAFVNRSSADYLLNFGSKVNEMFSQFLLGKALDSSIIGTLFFVGMVWFKIPYLLLLSIIVGVTNMIPYFGPFVGGLIVVIMTLFFSPVKALWVLICVIILQQFDGWILGPKILGDKVGLSPFWIIVAILVGGGTFGAIGMVLGVPIVAAVKVLFEEIIDKKLKQKEIDI